MFRRPLAAAKTQAARPSETAKTAGSGGEIALTCGLAVWFCPASIRGPYAFQAYALPTELQNHVMRPSYAEALDGVSGHPLIAVPTGFEPATSGLTGRRELHFTTGPDAGQHPQRDSNPCRHLERVVS